MSRNLRGLLAAVAVFGLTSAAFANETVLVPRNAVYSYFRGTGEPSPDGVGLPTTEWTEDGFDDSTWDEGPAGFGYGDQLGSIGTQLTDMSNGYWSVYLRHVFEVDDPDALGVLRLNVDYDDGFIAYLNGVEVARVGLAGDPPTFNTAATSHESTGTLEPIDIVVPDVLQAGDNVLAIQVHNTTLGSSDLVYVAELVANPSFCPTGLTCAADAVTGEVTLTWTNRRAAYDSIRVLRDDTVLVANIGGNSTSFVDDDAPIGTVNYKIIATDGQNPGCPECTPIECTALILDGDSIVIAPGDEWVYFKGTVQPPADWNLLDFDEEDWLFGPTGIGYGDGDDATILDDMLNNYASVYVRNVFRVADRTRVESASLSVIVDDGLVLYINGEEVARLNMPAGDVFNTTLATAAAAEGVSQIVDIDPALLVSGENIIAASVHNTTLGSSDLSFIPTLLIVESAGGVRRFRRGDIDSSGVVNLTDAVRLLDHLFRGAAAPLCADAADVDDNGTLALTDAIRLLGHLFRSEPAPPAPGLACGVDPTADALPACSTPGC